MVQDAACQGFGADAGFLKAVADKALRYRGGRSQRAAADLVFWAGAGFLTFGFSGFRATPQVVDGTPRFMLVGNLFRATFKQMDGSTTFRVGWTPFFRATLQLMDGAPLFKLGRDTLFEQRFNLWMVLLWFF